MTQPYKQLKTPLTTMVLVAIRTDGSEEWFLDWTFENIAEEGANRLILGRVPLHAHLLKLWNPAEFNTLATKVVAEQRQSRRDEINTKIAELEEEYRELNEG